MKLLHTSDWHVGKTIRGFSRADEHRAVLAEIAAVAEREEVDLIVIAGDLFDSAAPPPEAEEIVYRTLLAFAGTGAEVAVIAGNHDNARRLGAVAPVFEFSRVHLVTEPTRPDEGGVLQLRARDGSDMRVAMLPFVSKRGIVRAEHLMEHEAFENAQAYSQRLALVVAALCQKFDAGTVNILAAHAFVLGAVSGGGERAAHLVDEYAVTSQAFPASIGYAALGHLHRPQRIPGATALHYCGSPLQLDFGETEQAKQVNVVRMEPGVPADVTIVRLTAGQSLRSVVGTMDELGALAASVDDDTWLRVIVRGSAHAGLATRVRELFGERAVDIRVDSPTTSPGRTNVDHRQRSPQELFAEYMARTNVVDDRVAALFADLLDADHEVAAP